MTFDSGLNLSLRFIICRILPLSLMFGSPVLAWGGERPIVELEIFQALRANVPGSSADEELVRAGLPFPKGMVKVVDGRPALGVAGAAFQGRVLKRWPDGSVKWGLLEFLASPKKGDALSFQVTVGGG